MPRIAATLRSLNPIAALFGPVFQREVRTSGRKRGTYWLRFLFAAGLLGIVTLTFSTMRQTLSGMTGLQRFQTLQALAPMLATVVIWFQFAAMALLAPILTAPCVCDEKRARTLPALMTTPLSSGQIAFGMLSSRLVQLVILSLLSTPLLLAIRVFGGLEAEVVLAAACVSISTAFLGAALGLMYSVWHRRATTAALFALFSLALLQGGPLAVVSIAHDMADPASRGPFPENMLATCSPAVLSALSAKAVTGSAMVSGVGVRTLWIWNAVCNAALAGGIALATAVALRRVMVREAGGGAGASETASPAGTGQLTPAAPSRDTAVAASTEADTATIAPALAARSKKGRTHRDREVGEHPVLWREVRLPTFGSRRVFRIALGLAASILVLLYVFVGPYEPGLHATVLVIGTLAVMAQSLFLTAGGISGEREARTWDVLLCAPLGGGGIILGKFVGTLKAQWFVPTLVLGHVVLGAAIGAVHPLLVLHAAVIFAGPVLFFTGTGVLLSLLLRRGVTAAVVNLSIGLLLWAGSWIIAGLIAWYADLASADWYERVFQACYAVNPVAMIVSGAEPAVLEAGYDTFARRGDYEIIDDHMGVGAFTLITIGVFGGYAAGGVVALVIAIRGFRRLSGRAS